MLLQDNYENLFAQLVGSKEFLLWCADPAGAGVSQVSCGGK